MKGISHEHRPKGQFNTFISMKNMTEGAIQHIIPIMKNISLKNITMFDMEKRTRGQFNTFIQRKITSWQTKLYIFKEHNPNKA